MSALSTINWTTVGSTFSGLVSAFTAAGVSASSIPTLLQQVGLATNPNLSAELTLCSQIMQFAGEPTLVPMLAQKLATEQGIPPSAAALALTLGNPNVDIYTRVMQIEALIKQGG
jgi:hypothetical protein